MRETPLFIHFSMQAVIAKNCWSVWRILVSATPSLQGPQRDSSWTSGCCPYPVALGPADWHCLLLPTPILQQITDGVDVRVCQHITLVLDLGDCRFGPPANSYQLCFKDQVTGVERSYIWAHYFIFLIDMSSFVLAHTFFYYYGSVS